MSNKNKETKKQVRQWALIANKTREKTNGEMFGYERKPSNAKDREPSGLTIRIRIYSNGYSYKLKETLHGIHEMTSEHLFKGSNKHVSLNDKIRRSGFKFTDGELVVLPYEHEISAIMKASSEDLREALVKAAQEAFQNEIIDTDSMSEICQGSQFESREEWEEIKIEEWLGA